MVLSCYVSAKSLDPSIIDQNESLVLGVSPEYHYSSELWGYKWYIIPIYPDLTGLMVAEVLALDRVLREGGRVIYWSIYCGLHGQTNGPV